MAGETGSFTVKKGLAQMLKGGVIMDVSLPSMRVSRRTRAPQQLWRWNGFRRISAPRAASPA